MRLYLEGHNVRFGHAVSVTYSAAEIRSMPPCQDRDPPVRFFENGRHARMAVERFNRRLAWIEKRAAAPSVGT